MLSHGTKIKASLLFKGFKRNCKYKTFARINQIYHINLLKADIVSVYHTDFENVLYFVVPVIFDNPSCISFNEKGI